jgi:UDP-sugar transporter A1/2/3
MQLTSFIISQTLTTAGFSVVFLGRFVTMTKWRALILLVIGCVLVASPNFNQCLDSSASASKAATTDEDYIGTLLGVSSLLVIVTISGFSSVYLEGILKQTDIKVGIWHRNFQMAAWSAVFLVLADLYVRANSNHSYDAFLHDWSFNTVVIVILQAGGECPIRSDTTQLTRNAMLGGGLLVAATLKYADSILKTLAISGSIVLSAVLGYFLLGGQLDAFVSMGCLCTILAIFNYSFDTSA